MPPSPAERLKALQSQIWQGSVPLEVHLAGSDCRTYDESDPYLIQHPRLSYLAFLLPRLHSYFRSNLINPEVSPYDAWISFENVPMKWHYPLGLLYDVFSGAEPASVDQLSPVENAASQLPWKLMIHYTDYPSDQILQLDPESRAIMDSFNNSVKEADFIRNGTARAAMSLSKDDSDQLWEAVKTHNFTKFNQVNSKLLSPPGITIRHVPFKIYLPTSSDPLPTDSSAAPDEADSSQPRAGHIRIVQTLVPVQTGMRQPQTVGNALNTVLPTIFPSKRNPLLAQPVLHGAVVPLNANLADLGKAASYCDGFLHFSIVMMN